MQKHLLYINLFAISSALALTACADEVENAVTPDMPEVGEKTPIELSVGITGEEAPLTRGVITVLPENTTEYRAFANSTNLYMIYMCEDLSSAKRSTKYSKTIGLADQISNPGDGTWSGIDFARESYSADKGKFVRYWDDAYARESALSIFAICFNGCDAYGENGSTKDTRGITFGGSDYANVAWNTTERSALVSWNLSNTTGGFEQSSLPLIDICYSNNISKYTPEGSSEEVDARLKFGTQVSKKFDTGKMVFYHMTSKLTFIFKKGEGFTDDEFKFNTNTNVALNEFNRRVENFDVASGALASNGSYTAGTLSKLWEDKSAETGDNKFVIRGLVFPGTDISTENTNTTANLVGKDVVFYINNNKYEVSRTALFAAIKNNSANVGSDGKVLDKYLADGTTLKPGVHYIFTFTVGKTQIKNISATVADWETVTAEEVTPSNARIKLNLEERDGDVLKENDSKKDKFTLYRSEDNIGADAAINDNHAVYNWMSGYAESTTPSFVAATGETAAHWLTNWYWESNKHFYHFRVLTEAHGDDAKTAVNTTLSSDSKGVYLTIQAAETQSTNAYKDICWGAPMLDVTSGNDVSDAVATKPLKWYYDPEENGFDSDKNGKVSEALPVGTAHQIYKAIGPTEDQIKLILFHMMSDVTFKITTSAETDPDHVVFKEGSNVTKIELQKIYKTGHLYLGNGLVTGVFESEKTEKENYPFSATPEPNANNEVIWANYGAIPQDLTDVVLVITTADNNQYKVKMEDVWAAANKVTNNNIVNPYTDTKTENSTTYCKINRWYPGYKYTYTFKLTKKGITDLEATIVDWENVEAGDDTVQIE